MPTATTLHLTTPNELAEGFGHIGVRWCPAPVAETTNRCLYVWVTGADDVPQNEHGILYVGIDRSGKGERVQHEKKWISDGYHAQGRALHRTNATCVAAIPEVAPVDESKDKWVALQDRAANYPTDISDGRAWLNSKAEDGKLLQACEVFAVRLTVHLGDVGAPVNSQFKSAWAMKDSNSAFHADNLAFWVAQLMLRENYWAADRAAPDTVDR